MCTGTALYTGSMGCSSTSVASRISGYRGVEDPADPPRLIHILVLADSSLIGGGILAGRGIVVNAIDGGGGLVTVVVV